MKTIGLPSSLGLLLALCLHATPAAALLSRTWVASNGDDTNDCSRVAPCRSFQAAHDKTFADGEINCVDAADFTNGAHVTISKSITIDCGGTFGGTAGDVTGLSIRINGPDINVRLRNLSIQGLNANFVGIDFVNGNALFVENCTIFRFTGIVGHGIRFAPQPNGVTSQLYVTDSVVEGNGTGGGTGGGIFIQPSGAGSARVVIDRVRVNSNIHGIVADGTGTSGSIVVQVRDSTVSGNAGNGIWVKKAGVVVNRTSAINNAGYGIFSDGAGALVHLGSSTVSGNGGGLGASGGGTLLSYQNNEASGNGFDGAPTGVLTVK